MSGILDGIRVIDLSSGHSGPIAGQLLAEAGADVIKVESPGGDASRRLAAFATWNRSKRSIVLDLGTAEGSEHLAGLLADADVLLHGLRPAAARQHGLDDATLQQHYPRLIVSSILGYPTNHADAERPGYELLVQARSGMMDELMGWREGPIPIRFAIGSWAAAYLAAAGVLARLVHRLGSGVGGPAHTSLLQGLLNTVSLVWNHAENPLPALLSSKFDIPQQVAMYQCQDDVWLQIMNPGERIDIGAIPLTQTVLTELGDPGHPVDADRLRNAFHYRSSEVWLEALRAADVAVEPALQLGEVLSRPELSDNGYVVEVDDPTWGRVTQPTAPFDLSIPAQVQRPAPRLGEHTAEVLDDLAEREPVSVRSMGAGAPAGPHLLSGVNVLDVGAFLAGPMAPMLLGDLGADVIKVEPLSGDRMRFMSNYFESCSRGKRSIAVDLQHPTGQEILRRLIGWADIVHHNQRRKAAVKLGIDEAGIRAINPEAVFAYVSSYGAAPERADWPGFDSIFEALGGWEVENAGLDNPPLFSRFGSLDIQCALSSLVGTLLAFYAKASTGAPVSVRGSLLHTTAFSVSETLLLADGTLAPFRRLTQDQTGFGPDYRIYETTDGHVAVLARGDAQFKELLHLAAVTDADHLPTAFTGWTSEELQSALTAAGIAAEVVRMGQAAGFFENPDHAAAGLIAEYPHAAYGTMRQPGAYWNLGDAPLKLDAAAPVIGQHTREILAGLGYSDVEIDVLYADGIVVGPAGPV